MATRIATDARDAAAAAVAALLDGGTVEVRTGDQPGTPGTDATGTLLATLDLSDPAFGDPSSGTVTAAEIGAATVAASGTAAWFRGYGADGDAVIDGDVTGDGDGGAMTLDSASLVEGGTIELTGWTVTMPGS